MSRAEMDALGWEECDVILVTGDAYVDHPSFGMAVIGRTLEAQGYRVGIISQPDWRSADAFKILGRPRLFFGVTAGNMDSMINRYTADRKIRSDDAYTPDGAGGKRPDRSVVVYSQRCREAWSDVPLVIGGIEASLRRIAHYDYWQEKVRRSVLLDARADLLVYGNGERQVLEIAHRLAAGESVREIRDIRGTGFVLKQLPADWWQIDSSAVDKADKPFRIENPYEDPESRCDDGKEASDRVQQENGNVVVFQPRNKTPRDETYIKLPAYDIVKSNNLLYAHASRVLHLETNPGNARVLVQKHADRYVWLNPPPVPLTTKEMDAVFDLPYSRHPHTSYNQRRIPAYEMIRFSINIMRGCFGGCTFCSITEHEGRIIQSRSEDSIVREVEAIRDQVKGFTGVISDLGGPTANMYRIGCKSTEIEAACRKPSCVYPDICSNLNTDHDPLIQLYRRIRSLKGIKRVFVASGLRYDLAVKSPEYIKELVTHHVGGYLKIAPEHTEEGPLTKMMKPGMGAYDEFKELFEKFSREAGKEQYLIPYFIAAHPGSTNEDMLNLALWLKQNNFRLDQVQTFLPSPMATASAMYHSGYNPLRKLRKKESLFVARGLKQRRLQKAFLRYHDANNWPMLRDALKAMGRSDLIGNGKKHLIPSWQPSATAKDAGKDQRSEKGKSRSPGKFDKNNVVKKKAGKRPSVKKKKSTSKKRSGRN